MLETDREENQRKTGTAERIYPKSGSVGVQIEGVLYKVPGLPITGPNRVRLGASIEVSPEMLKGGEVISRNGNGLRSKPRNVPIIKEVVG